MCLCEVYDSWTPSDDSVPTAVSTEGSATTASTSTAASAPTAPTAEGPASIPTRKQRVQRWVAKLLQMERGLRVVCAQRGLLPSKVKCAVATVAFAGNAVFEAADAMENFLEMYDAALPCLAALASVGRIAVVHVDETTLFALSVLSQRDTKAQIVKLKKDMTVRMDRIEKAVAELLMLVKRKGV